MTDLGNKAVMARNILRFMEQKDVTRTDMCNDLDIKYTTLTDWVTGKSYPRIDKIELMASYFGVSKSDLVEDRQTARVKTDAELEILDLMQNYDANQISRLVEYARLLKYMSGDDHEDS